MTFANPMPLSQRLKAATRCAHESLDQRLMAFQPFSSRERYAAFLQVQYRFHRDVAPLFEAPMLERQLPGLRDRQRLAAVIADLGDIGQAVPIGYEPAVLSTSTSASMPTSRAPQAVAAAATPPLDLPTVLGWLYVEQGSHLGAAFLLKAAAGLGLDATRGAQHLAPLPGGRAMSWKAFVDQLDGVPLAPDEIERAEVAARAAFARVREHVEACCPMVATA